MEGPIRANDLKNLISASKLVIFVVSAETLLKSYSLKNNREGGPLKREI